MSSDCLTDVPSPIDLRNMADARAWEQEAMVKRPWRTEFFAKFCSEIAAAPKTIRTVLELGSGPGYLAKCLLESNDTIYCTLLDFSPAMHELAKARLGTLVSRASFIERSFKDPNWAAGLGPFDCVVTNQAVHELRHKRYAQELHAQVQSLLSPHGIYLVCDHFAGEGGMKNDQLYMTVDEQRAALSLAGFGQVDQLLCKGGMVLYAATYRGLLN